MVRYLSGRLVSGFVTLVVVVVLTFLMVRLAPGDPATFLAGLEASPDQVAALRERLGLDQPLPQQLWTYLSDLTRGDLGYSQSWNQDVMAVILSRLPATLLLMSVSFVFSIGAGVLLGVVASRKPYGRMDNFVTGTSLVGFSVPQFWVGMLLMLSLGLKLGLFPVQGMSTPGAEFTGFEATIDVLHHLVLPALALALTELAVIMRVTRASMMEVSEADFIRTARSKGIRERRVLLKHALRNAMLPLITVGALRLRTLFVGAILVEAIFGWPGIGSLTVRAMFERDYPMIVGITLWAALLTVLINFATDVAYGYVDPRIKSA